MQKQRKERIYSKELLEKIKQKEKLKMQQNGIKTDSEFGPITPQIFKKIEKNRIKEANVPYSDEYIELKKEIFKEKYDNLKIQEVGDHFTVSSKTSPEDVMDFYFYSFLPTIEDLANEKRHGNKGRSVSTIGVSDGKVLVRHYDQFTSSASIGKNVPGLMIGVNFSYKNDFKSHDNLASGSNCMPRKVERKDFKFLSKSNEPYNEHIALGAACGISPHLSVLTDTYYKIQNMQGKRRERYDEIVVYPSKRENKL